MELGKITRSYLTKREVTSDVIGSLVDKNKEGVYYSDTLSLVHVFSVHHAEFGHFYVSPLVQRYSGSNKPKAVMSLSKFQNVYSGQGYFAEVFVRLCFDGFPEDAQRRGQAAYFVPCC